MDNILIILTDKYPYDKGETYIETERPYWSKFDHVYICPVLVRKEDKVRESFSAMPHETVIGTEDNKPGLLSALRGLFGPVTISDYFRELKTLKRSGRLSLGNVRLLIFMGILSNLRIKRIEKALKPLLGDRKNEKRLLYSYWMYEPAIAATGLVGKLDCDRLISRVHRYDLYEELQKTGYIPFRERVLKKLDRLYSISDDGVKYFHENYDGRYDCKIFISRLGTVRKYEVCKAGKGEETVIASCSNLIPVKRVGLIIDALKKYDKPITWYHFGDGVLRDELEAQVKTLPGNVHARLMGFTLNDDIQRFYSEHYIDAFVNVSSSEGVPVSIMEAQSYGLPVIATDAGGTGELVHNGKNGVLLDIGFSDDDLLSAVEEVRGKGAQYRKGALETWENMSDSEKICDEFFDREIGILNDVRIGDRENEFITQ